MDVTGERFKEAMEKPTNTILKTMYLSIIVMQSRHLKRIGE